MNKIEELNNVIEGINQDIKVLMERYKESDTFMQATIQATIGFHEAQKVTIREQIMKYIDSNT